MQRISCAGLAAPKPSDDTATAFAGTPLKRYGLPSTSKGLGERPSFAARLAERTSSVVPVSTIMLASVALLIVSRTTGTLKPRGVVKGICVATCFGELVSAAAPAHARRNRRPA